MQIEVSIIIPTKNNQTQLNYCLESILNSEKNQKEEEKNLNTTLLLEPNN